MTVHSVGFLPTQGVLDRPSRHVLTSVNLQQLRLPTLGYENALLIIDCEDDAVAHKQMSPDPFIDVIHRIPQLGR